MNLWRITQALQDMESFIDTETGEINTERLDDLACAREDKIASICGLIKEMRAEADAIQNAVKDMTLRANRKKRSAESLLAYLQNCLSGQKWENEYHAVYYRKSKRVEEDMTILDPKYKRIKETIEPDKKAIKEAIESGEDVIGATIVTETHIYIK